MAHPRPLLGMSPEESSLPTPRIEGLRRRTTALFFSGVGLGSIGLTAAIIVSTLAAEEISRAATWSGLPSALSILGTAMGQHSWQRPCSAGAGETG